MSCFSTTVHGVDCRIRCTESAMEKSVGLEILGIVLRFREMCH